MENGGMTSRRMATSPVAGSVTSGPPGAGIGPFLRAPPGGDGTMAPAGGGR